MKSSPGAARRLNAQRSSAGMLCVTGKGREIVVVAEEFVRIRRSTPSARACRGLDPVRAAG